MTDATKAMRMALEALEAQHNDRTAYGRAKRKANATCAEFKNSPISELIESGYMQSMGKQTQEAIDALRAAMVKPTGYLIRARWSGGVETYLDVKGVTVLGGGKVGIDVDAPTSHPLADDPDAMAVLGCAQPQRATGEAAVLAKVQPVAWRYEDARGHFRYRGYVPGFDTEYAILKPIPLYAAAQAEPVADELGWLIEMRPSENLLWWDGGFDVSDDYPSKRLFARMVNDVNKAVRFSRREDAQCVLDAMLTVRPSPLFARASTLYSVQEHMWIAPTQPQQATPIGRVSRWGKRADGKPWMEAEFPQDGSADLPAGTPLYVAAQPLQPPQDELDQAKARIASLELEMRKIRPSLRGIFDRDLWDSLD